MKHLDMQQYIPKIHLKDVALTLQKIKRWKCYFIL